LGTTCRDPPANPGALKADRNRDDSGPQQGLDFIRTIVADDLKAGRNGGRVVTRFPPEPNGFMHIGHAASVCLNFGIAEEMGGVCHLRFDDTNPETEDVRYVDAMIEDIRWLGFDWGDNLYFASDYFPEMYAFAEHLIREDLAYVDSLSEEEIREYRGTVTEPGRPSPYRDRSVEENLDLFRRMQTGEFPDGAHVLRAKLDLAAANMRMRDPVFYRIRHAHHYRTGDRWRVYPLYDYAHPIEDAIECVTHSICTLEFVESRPIYDWIVDHIPRDAGDFHIPGWCRPRQYEFARRNLDYTVMSKRKLLQLVREERVSGWDDPRMPTIAGLRRRGFTPRSIRTFAQLAGVGKIENRTDIGKLEFAIRDELNQTAPRVMCVLRPLRVVLTNFPEGQVEHLDAPYFPRDIPREGSRTVPFSRVLYIDRDDFREDPPADYHRLAPGRDVRLRYAYVIRCDEVVRNEVGEIVELRCTYEADTRGGRTADGRAVKGTIQWVSAGHAVACEVRLYDRLFTVPDPDEREGDFTEHLNPDSLVVVDGALVEPSVLEDESDTRYQFERLGYFWRDPFDSVPGRPIFNRIVTLRDTWTRNAEAAERAVSAAGRQEGGGLSTSSAATSTASPGTAGGPSGDRQDALLGSASARGNGATEPRPDSARTDELESRRRRYVELGVGEAESEILTRDLSTADFFESALVADASPRTVANWLVHELPREATPGADGDSTLTPADFGRLVALVDDGTLSSSAGREVLSDMITTGEPPDLVVDRRGLRQISDPVVLTPIVATVVERHSAKADEYRAGRTGLLGLFVGQVMRETGGRANPEVVKRLIETELMKG